MTQPDGPVQAFDIDLDAPHGLPPSVKGCARVLGGRHGRPVAPGESQRHEVAR